MPECYQHSGNGSRSIKGVMARFGAGKKNMFGKSAGTLICRIGILVPVIILQVGILVP